MMMKRIILSLLIFCGAIGANAQSLNKGDIILNGNIGAPHLFKNFVKLAIKTPGFTENFSGYIEVSDIRGTNPVAIKTEYGFSNVFALGLNYSTWNIAFDVKDYYNVQNQNQIVRDSFDIYKLRVTSTSFGLRPVLHLPFDSWRHDVYFGLGLGITRNSLNIAFSSTDVGRLAKRFGKDLEYDLSLPGGVYFAPSVGYRVYFIPNLGLNFELGYEKGAIVQGGLVLRFNHYKEVREKQKTE